jgi:hypothetical protein
MLGNNLFRCRKIYDNIQWRIRFVLLTKLTRDYRRSTPFVWVRIYLPRRAPSVRSSSNTNVATLCYRAMSRHSVKLVPLTLYSQQIYEFANWRISSLARMWLAFYSHWKDMLRANGDERVIKNFTTCLKIYE